MSTEKNYILVTTTFLYRNGRFLTCEVLEGNHGSCVDQLGPTWRFVLMNTTSMVRSPKAGLIKEIRHIPPPHSEGLEL